GLIQPFPFTVQTELQYQIALTCIPQIGSVQSKILINHFGNAEFIFKEKKTMLEKIEGIGEIRARSIKKFDNFRRVEKENAFIEKYKITPLFLTDKNYPQRLLNCYDSPTLLYFKGNADLNCARIIALVGTRSPSEYGKLLVEKLVKDLSGLKVLVVSGLAFGIDTLAHKAAMKNGLLTLAVLGHGLDIIYPTEHTSIAKEMISYGGLLTEFMSQTKPDKHHFPIRNRIVAGISDATIVLETGMKGGSMITAELANGYNKDVFAFPGKIIDHKSCGCNELIRTNKAILITDAAELIETMGWSERQADEKKSSRQRELFVQLTENEKKVVDILMEKQTAHVDELKMGSKMSNSAAAAAILSLEMQGLISAMPGSMYALNV
ncbi:MAG: DNA-processing protein DprA, partial [Chitinophagales bacterium]